MPAKSAERLFLHALCNELATARASLEVAREALAPGSDVAPRLVDSLAAIDRVTALIEARRSTLDKRLRPPKPRRKK
jgi:hypothetical protein